MTLAEFLLARIAEDEARIRELPDDDPEPQRTHLFAWAPDPTPMVINKARWLPECKAKRRLVEWALGVNHMVDVGDPAAPRDRLGDAALRIVAQPYAEHPDYRLVATASR